MKRVLLNFGKVALLGAIALTFLASVALAGPHDDARIALHAKNNFSPSKTVPTLCDYSPNNPAAGQVECVDYSVARPTNEFPGPHVFLMVGQGGTVGIGGASCGINYSGTPGVGIDPRFVTFNACADGLVLPNDGGNGDFPAPLGGLRVTWLTCQTTEIGGSGVHANIGAFYVYAYSEDVLTVTANNNLLSGPELAVTACAGGTSQLLEVYGPNADGAMGKVHFGGNGSLGYTPCGVVPARETTWGKLKNQYQDQE